MNDNKPGRKPNFTGEGIAVWINVDSNGNKYLSVKKPEWAKNVPAFANKDRVKPIAPAPAEDYDIQDVEG